MTEAELQEQVAEYLRRHYPDVIFHSDYGSGARLTPKQASIQKRQNGGRRAWPDMFIAEPAYAMTPLAWVVPDGKEDEVIKKYHGLFIELKREGTRLTKLNGDWATPHIAEQAEMLGRLLEKGYYADFACGFEEAKELIDKYLKGGQ